MARILPDGWSYLAETGSAERERETLTLLAAQLPSAYTVFHGVHWTRLDRNHAVFGEADFVIVNRCGDLLVIEQKNGLLRETSDGLFKHYPERQKNVPVQMARTRDALVTRLRARPGCQRVHVESLLFCPDHHIRDPLTAGLIPERIVDASQRDSLCTVIQAILPAGTEQTQASSVLRFLQDLISLEPDVSAMLGQAERLVTRLSGGLAYWARCIDVRPFRLRVTGTAGSGKTQLALAEYRACLEQGGRPLYLCFNRPLADHFAQIAPEGGMVANFHLLCDRRLRARGVSWDYRQPHSFEALVEASAALPIEESERFDTVIIDEAQDFEPGWVRQSFLHAREDARLLWLEDPLQNLYDRPVHALPGWTGLRARANYRSPREIVTLLNRLLEQSGQSGEIEPHSPLQGEPPVMLVYRNPTEMLERVKEGLRLCWQAGFRAEDTVLLSYHGRAKSALLQIDRLGPERLRRFSGDYDLFGMPLYGEGEVLSESVLRFKGQSAPAVVFAELDFACLDARALRRVFVGITRARLKIVLVLSEAAAAVLTAL